MTVAAIVPAAGSGEPPSAGISNALLRVAGRELLVHTIDRLRTAGVSTIVVMVPADRVDLAAILCGSPVTQDVVVAGWADETAFLAAGLAAVPASADVVLVHEAVRAFAPVSLVERVVARVRAGADAVVPVLPVVDTVRGIGDHGALTGIVDRSRLRIVQTPQGFRPDVLRRAQVAAAERGDASTDVASLVAAIGVPVTAVDGDRAALKITTPDHWRDG